MRIRSITIKNFKACQHVEFKPGRINVLIGSNGSGKSTLLEGIGLLCAAMTDRVNNTTLMEKGIRLSTSHLYQSSFKSVRRSPTMNFEVEWDDAQISHSDTFTYKVYLNPPNEENSWRYHSEVLLEGDKKICGRSGASYTEYNPFVGNLMLENSVEVLRVMPSIMKFKKYGIYQPNTPVLRGTTPDPYQTEPVGLCGGRLAEAIDDILSSGNGEKFGSLYIDDVQELIGWARQIKITPPSKHNINASVSAARRVIEFSDRYMSTDKRFTAYDASEGALYVLLLLSLAVHEKSPTVFSIDNFDHAMNPRLAKVAIKTFCDLILDTDKIVFLTTHNPLALDGLDIQNDSIRLFTMDRSREGYAKLRRIEVEQSLIDENQPLSRLWVNGRIGGMPEQI